jgi:hypothetical protein
MSEVQCSKCGTDLQPADLFCRKCGTPVSFTSVVEDKTKEILPTPEPDLATDSHLTSQKLSGTARSALLLVSVGLFVIMCVLIGASLLLWIAQPSNKLPIALELLSTPTVYPTNTPIRTARPYLVSTPYPTLTPYPTFAPYPTTGPLSTAGPAKPTDSFPHLIAPVMIDPFNRGCTLAVHNLNINLDAVVILLKVDDDTITTAGYVRGRDSLYKSGFKTGYYFVYVMLGQNWNSQTNRFNNDTLYFRFRNGLEFVTKTYSWGMYGSYCDSTDVILDNSEGPGADTIEVSPDDFPLKPP